MLVTTMTASLSGRGCCATCPFSLAQIPPRSPGLQLSHEQLQPYSAFLRWHGWTTSGEEARNGRSIHEGAARRGRIALRRGALGVRAFSGCTAWCLIPRRARRRSAAKRLADRGVETRPSSWAYPSTRLPPAWLVSAPKFPVATARASGLYCQAGSGCGTTGRAGDRRRSGIPA